MHKPLIRAALATICTMTSGYSLANALTLDFEVLANERWERILVPPDIVLRQDPTFQPVTFDFSTEFEPIVIDVEDSWDMEPNDFFRQIDTHFSDPSHVSLTPFDAEMNAQNFWGLGPLNLNPWYHGYRAVDVMHADSFARSVIRLSYALYAMEGDRLYHHLISLNGSNPSYPPPAASLDDMAPWTSDMLLQFINHPQTEWVFVESAWSEEATEVSGEVVYTFYDEVLYHGPATLIPEPATLSLFALCGLRLPRRQRA